ASVDQVPRTWLCAHQRVCGQSYGPCVPRVGKTPQMGCCGVCSIAHVHTRWELQPGLLADHVPVQEWVGGLSWVDIGKGCERLVVSTLTVCGDHLARVARPCEVCSLCVDDVGALGEVSVQSDLCTRSAVVDLVGVIVGSAECRADPQH